MPCPICGHTMQNLGDSERRIFWCQRCGTLKEERGDFSRVEIPLHLRHVIDAARRSAGSAASNQYNSVDCTWRVTQYDQETPRLEMQLRPRP